MLQLDLLKRVRSEEPSSQPQAPPPTSAVEAILELARRVNDMIVIPATENDLSLSVLGVDPKPRGTLEAFPDSEGFEEERPVSAAVEVAKNSAHGLHSNAGTSVFELERVSLDQVDPPRSLATEESAIQSLKSVAPAMESFFSDIEPDIDIKEAVEPSKWRERLYGLLRFRHTALIPKLFWWVYISEQLTVRAAQRLTRRVGEAGARGADWDESVGLVLRESFGDGNGSEVGSTPVLLLEGIAREYTSLFVALTEVAREEPRRTSHARDAASSWIRWLLVRTIEDMFMELYRGSASCGPGRALYPPSLRRKIAAVVEELCTGAAAGGSEDGVHAAHARGGGGGRREVVEKEGDASMEWIAEGLPRVGVNGTLVTVAILRRILVAARPAERARLLHPPPKLAEDEGRHRQLAARSRQMEQAKRTKQQGGKMVDVGRLRKGRMLAGILKRHKGRRASVGTLGSVVRSFVGRAAAWDHNLATNAKGTALTSGQPLPALVTLLARLYRPTDANSDASLSETVAKSKTSTEKSSRGGSVAVHPVVSSGQSKARTYGASMLTSLSSGPVPYAHRHAVVTSNFQVHDWAGADTPIDSNVVGARMLRDAPTLPKPWRRKPDLPPHAEPPKGTSGAASAAIRRIHDADAERAASLAQHRFVRDSRESVGAVALRSVATKADYNPRLGVITPLQPVESTDATSSRAASHLRAVSTTSLSRAPHLPHHSVSEQASHTFRMRDSLHHHNTKTNTSPSRDNNSTPKKSSSPTKKQQQQQQDTIISRGAASVWRTGSSRSLLSPSSRSSSRPSFSRGRSREKMGSRGETTRSKTPQFQRATTPSNLAPRASLASLATMNSPGGFQNSFSAVELPRERLFGAEANTETETPKKRTTSPKKPRRFAHDSKPVGAEDRSLVAAVPDWETSELDAEAGREDDAAEDERPPAPGPPRSMPVRQKLILGYGGESSLRRPASPTLAEVAEAPLFALSGTRVAAAAAAVTLGEGDLEGQRIREAIDFAIAQEDIFSDGAKPPKTSPKKSYNPPPQDSQESSTFALTQINVQDGKSDSATKEEEEDEENLHEVKEQGAQSAEAVLRRVNPLLAGAKRAEMRAAQVAREAAAAAKRAKERTHEIRLEKEAGLRAVHAAGRQHRAALRSRRRAVESSRAAVSAIADRIVHQTESALDESLKHAGLPKPKAPPVILRSGQTVIDLRVESTLDAAKRRAQLRSHNPLIRLLAEAQQDTVDDSKAREEARQEEERPNRSRPWETGQSLDLEDETYAKARERGEEPPQLAPPLYATDPSKTAEAKAEARILEERLALLRKHGALTGTAAEDAINDATDADEYEALLSRWFASLRRRQRHQARHKRRMEETLRRQEQQHQQHQQQQHYQQPPPQNIPRPTTSSSTRHNMSSTWSLPTSTLRRRPNGSKSSDPSSTQPWKQSSTTFVYLSSSSSDSSDSDEDLAGVRFRSELERRKKQDVFEDRGAFRRAKKLLDRAAVERRAVLSEKPVSTAAALQTVGSAGTRVDMHRASQSQGLGAGPVQLGLKSGMELNTVLVLERAARARRDRAELDAAVREQRRQEDEERRRRRRLEKARAAGLSPRSAAAQEEKRHPPKLRDLDEDEEAERTALRKRRKSTSSESSSSNDSHDGLDVPLTSPRAVDRRAHTAVQRIAAVRNETTAKSHFLIPGKRPDPATELERETAHTKKLLPSERSKARIAAAARYPTTALRDAGAAHDTLELLLRRRAKVRSVANAAEAVGPDGLPSPLRQRPHKSVAGWTGQTSSPLPKPPAGLVPTVAVPQNSSEATARKLLSLLVEEQQQKW